MEFPRHPSDRKRLNGSWSSEPVVVDGYQSGGLPWPIETSRFAYVTPFGGVTEELPKGYVGVNKQALQENTALRAGDEVTLSVFEGGRAVPLVMRPTFQVVGLDFGLPDAFLHSVEGEAVLPMVDVDQQILGLEGLSAGARIILNGVLAVRGRRPA